MISFFDLNIKVETSFPKANDAFSKIQYICVILYNEQNVSSDVYIFSSESSKDFKNINKNEIENALGIRVNSINEYLLSTEREMILSFLDFSSDINTYHGYNINDFDFTYLVNRADRLDIAKDNFARFTTVDLITNVRDLNEDSAVLYNFVKKHYPELDQLLCNNLLDYLVCPFFTIKVWQYFNDKKIVNEDTNTGYHLTKITKGVLGEFSKIKEEFLEAEDAIEQNNSVMALVELSDLLGAIEAYAKTFNMTLNDLLTMKDATKRAFETGRRK